MRFPHKLSFCAWRIVTAAALLLTLWFAWQTAGFYRREGASAVAYGKRVVVDVATGGVIMRAEPAEAPAEEVGPPVADQPPEDTAPHYEGVSIAVLMTGVGLNKDTSESVLLLPPQVGISVSPYAPDAKDWVARANQGGHETFLDLPLEPEDYPLTDPGPNTLLVRAGKAKNLFRLTATLSAAQGYKGVVATPGEIFTHALTSVLPLIDELKKQNLMFIYREEPRNAFLFNEAKAVGVPVVNQTVPLDDVPSPEAIDRALALAREQAIDRKQTVLVTGRPYPLTVIKLSDFLSRLTGEGIALVPVSNAVATQKSEEQSGDDAPANE